MTETATAQQITAAARNAGWESANEMLVTAVLNGTALIPTTGAGVSPELAAFIHDAAYVPGTSADFDSANYGDF
jgi:hypothetical protein